MAGMVVAVAKCSITPTTAQPDATVERWDPQMMIFTSGTTGPSKGVLCTYLQINTAARVQYGYMNEPTTAC